jgi:hypothetical protein
MDMISKLFPTNISTKTNMPPNKSTRVRKPANRLPKSLAALPIGPPIVPEPLDLPIDPRLLDVAIDDDVDRQFSPFSDGYIEDTQPQSPSPFDISQLPNTHIQGRRRSSTSSDPS